MRIDLRRESGEPRRGVDAIEAFCLERGVSTDIIFKFQVSLDEMLANVVNHGFEGVGHDPVITLDMRIAEGHLEVVIRDNGRPFDPLTEAPVPDITAPLEQRPVGGLGVAITKSLIDTVAYERVEGYNQLTLKQPLGAAENKEGA